MAWLLAGDTVQQARREVTMSTQDEQVEVSLKELQVRYRRLRLLGDVLAEVVKSNGAETGAAHQALLERMTDEELQQLKTEKASVTTKELLLPLRDAIRAACDLRSTDGRSIELVPKTLYIETTTYASLKAEHQAGFFKRLKLLGDGHLIKRTINAQTLSAWARKVDAALQGAAQSSLKGMPTDPEEVKLNQKRESLVRRYLTTYTARRIKVR